MDNTQLLKGVLPTAVLATISSGHVYGYSILRALRSAGFSDVGDTSGCLRNPSAALLRGPGLLLHRSIGTRSRAQVLRPDIGGSAGAAGGPGVVVQVSGVCRHGCDGLEGLSVMVENNADVAIRAERFAELVGEQLAGRHARAATSPCA